jgi:hypothetical protein
MLVYFEVHNSLSRSKYKLTYLEVLYRAADSDRDPLLLDIYTSMEAILFLGTPHRGSNKAGVAEVIRKIVSVSGFDAPDQNIRALQINSAELENVHENFMKLYGRQDRHAFQIFTFKEDKGPIGISYLKLNEKVGCFASHSS